MKYLSTFSGIGGFEIGINKAYEELQKLCIENEEQRVQRIGDTKGQSSKFCNDSSIGFTCIGYSEINKYADQIYQSKFPEHKNYGDITKINEKELPDFDLFVGGFPCQAFSIAGKRGGFDDTRGTLFFDCARILKEKQPRNFILENVKGLLSHDNGRTFKTIINTLTELGYCVEWQVLNAKNFGVPQNRERVFIVGHLGGIPKRKVFPITGADREIDETSGVQSVSNPRELSRTLLARDYKDPKVVQVADYRNDEGLRIRSEPISPCLSARRTSATDISTMPPVILRGRPKMPYEQGKRELEYKTYNKIVPTLSTNPASGDQKNMVQIETRIRRLTPLECERLMGYPEHKNYAILELCYDQAKSYVNAVLQNPKLQKLVLSVENKEWKELAEYVEKNLQLKNQLNENTAQENVSLKNTTLENPQSLSVNSVEKKSRKPNQELEEDSAPLNVLIDITEGRIILNGKEGLQVKELEQIAHQDGQDVVRLFGKEIMQLAEDVISDSLTEKIKPLMSTISSDSETKKLDTMLVILYFYVTNVINGFIQEKIPNKNISLGFRTINGWTEGLSDTQRYKTLGNGIVSNVVAEVVKRLYN